MLRADGFPPADGLTVAEVTELVPRALRLAEPMPTLSPVAEAGFLDLMEALRDTGVPVVAVAVPFSPPYQDGLEQRQAGWEASRQALVQRLEQAGDLPISDPLRFGDWWGDGSSRDPRHLSTKGAKAFTRQLLQMPDVREELEAALGATGSPTPSVVPGSMRQGPSGVHGRAHAVVCPEPRGLRLAVFWTPAATPLTVRCTSRIRSARPGVARPAAPAGAPAGGPAAPTASRRTGCAARSSAGGPASRPASGHAG